MVAVRALVRASAIAALILKGTSASMMARKCVGCSQDVTACSAKWDLRFLPGSLVVNNLGGMGPNKFHKQAMVLADVFPESGARIDLEVTAIGNYTPPDVNENGLRDGFLYVSVKSGTTTNLRFHFRNRRQREFVEVPKVLFTVANLSYGLGDFGVPVVTSKGHDGYFLSDMTSVEVDEAEEVEGRPAEAIFSPSVPDNNRRLTVSDMSQSDADIDAFNWTREQWRKAVTLLYTEASVVDLSLTAPKSGSAPQGSVFLISGSDQMACPFQMPVCTASVCPDTHVLRESAKGRRCSSKTCSASHDIHMCCQVVFDQECKADSRLELRPDSLLYSNLCGQGPDLGRPHEIVFADVFPNKTGIIDLHITKLHGKCPAGRYNSTRNSWDSGFGTIGVLVGSHLDLEFRFIHRNNGQIARDLDGYFLTFMGIDFDQLNDHNGADLAEIKVRGQDFFIFDRASFRRNGTNKFLLTREDRFPHSIEHTKSPLALTPYHAQQTLSVRLSRGRFRTTLRLRGKRHNGSRSFFFTGATNAVCKTRALCSTMQCPTDFVHKQGVDYRVCSGAKCDVEVDVDTCCVRPECHDRRRLHLHTQSLVSSNLGGLGPDFDKKEVILYHDVVPGSTSPVDLEVSTDGLYTVHLPEMNGLAGEFGRIHAERNQTIHLKFRFMQGGLPKTMPAFLITFVNMNSDVVIDGSSKTEGAVTVAGYRWFAITRDSELAYQTHRSEGHRYATFSHMSSIPMNRTISEPLNALYLTDAEIQHTATVAMPPVAWFDVSFTVGNAFDGGDLLFAGSSNMVCASRQLCGSYPCPDHFELRPDAVRISCSAWPCGRTDLHTCCRPVASQPPK